MFWPWWAGGIALGVLALAYWLVERRLLGVSGHVTRIVEAAARPEAERTSVTAGAHLCFLVALALGGLLGAAVDGRVGVHGMGETFERTIGSGPHVALLMLAGGVMVGFGTRMSGGCTSGHGLCGTSRLQPASLLSTAVFFGTAILFSFLMQWLVR